MGCLLIRCPANETDPDAISKPELRGEAWCALLQAALEILREAHGWWKVGGSPTPGSAACGAASGERATCLPAMLAPASFLNQARNLRTQMSPCLRPCVGFANSVLADDAQADAAGCLANEVQKHSKAQGYLRSLANVRFPSLWFELATHVALPDCSPSVSIPARKAMVKPAQADLLGLQVAFVWKVVAFCMETEFVHGRDPYAGAGKRLSSLCEAAWEDVWTVGADQASDEGATQSLQVLVVTGLAEVHPLPLPAPSAILTAGPSYSGVAVHPLADPHLVDTVKGQILLGKIKLGWTKRACVESRCRDAQSPACTSYARSRDLVHNISVFNRRVASVSWQSDGMAKQLEQ